MKARELAEMILKLSPEDQEKPVVFAWYDNWANGSVEFLQINDDNIEVVDYE